MGRDLTADKKPLLMDADQNIGNSAIVPPEIGPGPTTPGGTTTPITNPPRLLLLTGGSAVGQTTSVVFTASRLNKSPTNPNPGFAGPITGILEFGNGGRSTRVEFDVPVGPFIGSQTKVIDASEPQDGGVIVTVPTGVLRAYVRYDNRLIAPTLLTDVINFPYPRSLAQIQGVFFIGPGGPVSFPRVPPDNFFPAEPIQAKAMAAYFSRHTSKVYKTLYLYVANLGGMGATPVTVSSTVAPAPLQAVQYCLPAFTRSVKVLRLPISAALTCILNNGVNDIDQINIAAGTSAPTIPIIGNENIISLQSLTNTLADQVISLALVCEIGI